MDILNNEESVIDGRILRAIKEMGFEQLTPIQEQAIPLMLEGKDIIGQAQTGTGKTAAFGIPVIQSIDIENENVQCIILCPTRELAVQASAELRKLTKYVEGVKVLPVYGGQDINKQIRSLSGKVSIVIGTPGRVMDHMRRNTLKLGSVKAVVLDEADEMLNMGFREDIETILAGIPGEHQTALFSATMPQAILDITNTYQKDAVMIKLLKKELTIPLVKQYYYEVSHKNKEAAVARLLDYYNPKQSLIFCNTKKMVDELTEKLKGRGYFAEGLHGDMSQLQRDKVMNGFRNGTVEILIATDVAARGIDVDDIEAVFNYDIPQDVEYYVHRIGRTGRAGRKGRSFTLVVGREIFKIREIEHLCRTKIKVRTIPSAADITAVKAEKALNQVIGLLHESDLTEVTKIIEQKLNDEDCTALELASAFLKLHMGEPEEDIPAESYIEKMSGHGRTNSGRGRSRAGSFRYESEENLTGGRRRWRQRASVMEEMHEQRHVGENIATGDGKKSGKRKKRSTDAFGAEASEMKMKESEVSAGRRYDRYPRNRYAEYDMLLTEDLIEEEVKKNRKTKRGEKKAVSNEIPGDGYVLWDRIKTRRDSRRGRDKSNEGRNSESGKSSYELKYGNDKRGGRKKKEKNKKKK